MMKPYVIQLTSNDYAKLNKKYILKTIEEYEREDRFNRTN